MDRDKIKDLRRLLSFRVIDINILLCGRTKSPEVEKMLTDEMHRIESWVDILRYMAGPETTPTGFIPFVEKYSKLPVIPKGTPCLKRDPLELLFSSTTREEHNNFVSYGVTEFCGIIYVLCDIYRFCDNTHCIYIKLSTLKKLYKQQNNKTTQPWSRNK